MKKLKKIKATRKQKILTGIIMALLLMVFGYSVFTRVATWLRYHEIVTPERLVEFKLNKPFEVQKRETLKPIVVTKEVVLDYPDEIDTDLEKYICNKFGTYECKTALAVAMAESGMNEQAYAENTNGSLDIGVFQVNSIHWDKEGCSPKELFDSFKNVDCAYQIWTNTGWSAWVAYNRGRHLAHL